LSEEFEEIRPKISKSLKEDKIRDESDSLDFFKGFLFGRLLEFVEYSYGFSDFEQLIKMEKMENKNEFYLSFE
jgi:hypothetical protein